MSNVPLYLTDEESVLVGWLKDIMTSSWVIRNLTEQWLIEVGLSPASQVAHAPMPVSTIAQSSLAVQEIQAEAIPQKGTEAYRKQPTEGAPHLRKKVKASYHHKSQQGGESSKSHLLKSKEQARAAGEAQTPYP
ncbi:hypothetical protein B296_00037781 [Ensete ventricosum]|uniref:Uncharacterized protein n=1 Tax=Ensete ventricosum TaxID=4639 RepID=A0A426XYA8_ENSVE|nr:hypothetical protein B296_00037781 [Ensete ventricosum]